MIPNIAMVLVAVFVALVVCSAASPASGVDAVEGTVLFEWVEMAYDWKAMGENEQAWVDAGLYIAENCVLAGIKQWGETVFVTIPRWAPGVPATLNRLVEHEDGALLVPFPAVAAQMLNNTQGLKNVQGRPEPRARFPSLSLSKAQCSSSPLSFLSFSLLCLPHLFPLSSVWTPSQKLGIDMTGAGDIEIDPFGRMWIIDTGALNFYYPDQYEWNTPRLLVYDLATGDEPTLLREFSFPADVAVPGETFINDIVVDVLNDFAFMTNSVGDGGLFAYDYRNNVARKWVDPSTAVEPDGVTFNVTGSGVYEVVTPSDGIALSPDVGKA